MSMHDFGLLSAPHNHDHFPSAFMQGYHNQSFDHERFPPNSAMASHAPLERFLHPMHSEAASSTRDPYLSHDRRLAELSSRATYMPRQSLPSAHYPPSFEYTHNPISQSNLLHGSRGPVSPVEHNPGIRSMAGFDPRPPHAGWTPKEEIDDDEQTRELLAGSVRNATHSPQESHLSMLQSPEEPRDASHSPGNAGPAGTLPSTLSKTYSFVSLPGNAVRKRPRRRYDEIERLYACSWPDCTKAYGTLNHLNAHVNMQRHGSKRSPAEFKELRKQWRQQKKQETTAVNPASVVARAGSRRRRATESTLSLSLSIDNDLEQSMQKHPHPTHRLSLGDLHYSGGDDDGPSPTSSASDSVAYWGESPISPTVEHHSQSRAVMHYSVPIAETSVPLARSHEEDGDIPPPLNRLPPDSTLLTPLPGYCPPSPPISRLAPDSTLLQPLHPSTLAALTPPHHPRSPEYDNYQDRRSA